MKPIVKIFFLFFLLALIFAAGFHFFGEQAELMFSQERCIVWFMNHKKVAWVLAILLLVSDILLPIPATGIMAALGAVYGLETGIALSFTGSVLAGLAGYGAARLPGKQAVGWIATDAEIQRFKSFFDHYGGYAVILSRALPIMPETVTILAGFSRMKFSRFLTSLTFGTLPVSILFTWMGTGQGINQPLGIILAVAVPGLLWPFFIKFTRL